MILLKFTVGLVIMLSSSWLLTESLKRDLSLRARMWIDVACLFLVITGIWVLILAVQDLAALS